MPKPQGIHVRLSQALFHTLSALMVTLRWTCSSYSWKYAAKFEDFSCSFLQTALICMSESLRTVSIICPCWCGHPTRRDTVPFPLLICFYKLSAQLPLFFVLHRQKVLGNDALFQQTFIGSTEFCSV